MTDPRPIRCFLGVPVDTAFSAQMQPLLTGLRAQSRAGLLRWVEPRNLHVTLAFLGDQPLQLIQSLHSELLSPLHSVPAFLLAGEHISTFPDAKSSIVALEFHASAGLQRLKDMVDAALLQQGLTPEQRPLRPHITLAQGRRGQHLPLQSQPCTLTLPASELKMFQSVQSAAGSDYQPLWSINLAGNSV